MAQRNSPPNRPGSSKSGGSGAKAPGGRGSAGGASRASSGTATGGPARKPPVKGKPGKSIVNQKQTPWGLIAATAAVVVFAAAIVAVVIATHKSDKKVTAAKNTSGCTAMIGTNSMPYLNELQCAKDISGVTFKAEAGRDHVTTTVKYDSSPPVGGNHSQLWADCTGKVYSTQIANENAVHMLEHGAVWITYNPETLSKSGLAELKTYVSGVDRMALSPYSALKTPISLQAWGYQLFVNSASDPRIARFISALKYNQKTTPEPGASCSDPYFKASESTPGHPQFTTG